MLQVLYNHVFVFVLQLLYNVFVFVFQTNTLLISSGVYNVFVNAICYLWCVKYLSIYATVCIKCIYMCYKLFIMYLYMCYIVEYNVSICDTGCV